MDADEIQSEIGSNADGVAAGKNIEQAIRRDSPNVSITQAPQYDFSYLLNQVMQVSIDLRFLNNKQREDAQRQAEETARLTRTMEALHHDFQQREASTRENNRVMRDVINALERSVEMHEKQIKATEDHVDNLRNYQPMPQWQATAQTLALYILVFVMTVGIWYLSQGGG